MSTRRKFLLGCSAISAAALAVPSRVLAEAALPWWRQKSLDDLCCEDFAGQLNTTFLIHAAPDKSIRVKLDKVSVRPDKPMQTGQRPPPEAGNETFSLFFVGCRSELLGQNTYTFEHEDLGRFDLFIVPIFTRSPHEIDYQIVFNRPRYSGTPQERSKARAMESNRTKS
jgi:hypothetical protein